MNSTIDGKTKTINNFGDSSSQSLFTHQLQQCISIAFILFLALDRQDEDSNQQYDDDEHLFNDHESFEDQVNKIVASPNQASLFAEDTPQAVGKSTFSQKQEKPQAKEEESKVSQFRQDSSSTTGAEIFRGESVAFLTKSNSELPIKKSQNQQLRRFQFSNKSAFHMYKSEKKEEHKKLKTQQQNKVFQNENANTDDVEEQDPNSLFSISENILMMLNQESDHEDSQQQLQQQQQQHQHPQHLQQQNPQHQHQQQLQKYENANKPPKRSERNFLYRMTRKIVETIQKCNPRFNYLPFINPRKDLTFPSEGVLNNGYDNIDNDYILRSGDYIITPEGKEYEILDLLGKGTFGQVVKCQCKQGKEMVAIKVIKNKKAFKNQGVIEIKILDIVISYFQLIQLNRVYDPNGDSPIVRMMDFFVFRDHLCIVFELLSVSLFDLLKENQFNGHSLNFSRLIISQILDGMKVIKDARLIHCDLKPENILFKTKDKLNLKIIDLGSACFEGYAIFQYIQSRYYRSPEVLMGLKCDTAIDMWSLGCICAELFLGIPIFPGNSEYDQLSRIIEILGLPAQHLIQQCRFRDKFFVYCQQTMSFRFKNFDEFQSTNNIRLEIPKKYIHLTCLDDLKTRFIQKKKYEQYEQAQRDGRMLDFNTFRPVISESEMNTMDAFIDFLKGILRIDKETRWTPAMAMEHPFITREQFYCHFEPVREQERRSTNETGEDTMSERSSSSKDSKDYKAGSCPSKLLYPQTASLPQYLQHQQNSFSFLGQGQQNFSGSDYVFHGSNPQSHRPPILSIPDEYFKGFMFGRLDQILSMTREQLFQFIYEQNELAFRQSQIYQMRMLQQQQYFIQQQQIQMMNNNPMLYQEFLQQQAQQNQINSQSQIMYQQLPRSTQQFLPQNQFQQPGLVRNNYDMQANLQQQQMIPFDLQMSQQQMTQPNINAGLPQIGIGGGQFLPGPVPQQNIIFPQQAGFLNPGGGGGFPQSQQRFMMPPEQIIFNPPPYAQQKTQLSNHAQFAGDPQYQEMLLQQQKRKGKMFPPGGGMGAGGNGHNKGKTGSWQPPQGIQQHKYNQYYNQINNPGQIIGRPQQLGDTSQQFIHPNRPHQKIGHNKANEKMNFSEGSLPTTFTKNDFKKLKDQKANKFFNRMTSDQIATSIIPEEQYNKTQQQQSNDNSNKSQNSVPFPQNSKQIFGFTDQINQNAQKQERQFIPLFPDFSQHLQEDPHSIDPSSLSGRFQNKPQFYQDQQMQFSQQPKVFGQKQFPSPKLQNQSVQSFITNQKNQQQQQQFLQQQQQLSQQQIQQNFMSQSLENQQLNISMTSNQSQASLPPSGKGFLKKFEQSSTQKQFINNTQNQEKSMFNHHYQYQKHMLPNPVNQHQTHSHSQSVNLNSYRNRSNSDQLDENVQQISSHNLTQSFHQTEGSQLGDNQSEDSQGSQKFNRRVSGFQNLKEQIIKQGINNSYTIHQPPHSAKGNLSFKFENVQYQQQQQQQQQPIQDNFQQMNQFPQSAVTFNQQMQKRGSNQNMPYYNEGSLLQKPLNIQSYDNYKFQSQNQPFTSSIFSKNLDTQFIGFDTNQQLLHHHQYQQYQQQQPQYKQMGSFKKESSNSFKNLSPVDEDGQDDNNIIAITQHQHHQNQRSNNKAQQHLQDKQQKQQQQQYQQHQQNQFNTTNDDDDNQLIAEAFEKIDDDNNNNTHNDTSNIGDQDDEDDSF